MKKSISIIFMMVCAILVVFNSCKKEKVETTTEPEASYYDELIPNAVTDIDGNTYNAVKLGQQVWMAANLRTTKYADGTTIPVGDTLSQEVAYRYYPNNDSSATNISTYGYLYNWPAARHNSETSFSNPSGVQGICPNGWHLPSKVEYVQLLDYLRSQNKYICGGEKSYIAKALASTTGWKSSDVQYSPGNDPSSNNATGFSAVPAGLMSKLESQWGFGDMTNIWSCSRLADAYDDFAYILNISASDPKTNYLMYDGLRADIGCSVRCVRD